VPAARIETGLSGEPVNLARQDCCQLRTASQVVARFGETHVRNDPTAALCLGLRTTAVFGRGRLSRKDLLPGQAGDTYGGACARPRWDAALLGWATATLDRGRYLGFDRTDRAQGGDVSKPSTRPEKRWARILFPDQFQLGVKGLAGLCDWHVRAVESGRPLVIPRERYQGVTARMVEAVKIGDAARPFEDDLIRQAVARLSYGRLHLQSELPELPQDVVNPQTREEFWGALRLRLMMSTDDELPKLLRLSFGDILGQFPEASLWYVALTPRAIWRAATIRALFASAVAPETLTRRQEDFRGFPPGGSLIQSLLVGLRAYLEPVLMLNAPWLIGWDGPRNAGSIIVLFGRSEPGFVGRQLPEMISALRSDGLVSPAAATHRPEVPATTSEALLRYWVDRLDALLSRALDPTEFVAAGGDHLPGEHLAAVSSIESMFVALQTLLGHAGRDPHVRQMAMFSILDHLDGMDFDDWIRMVTPNKVARAASALAGELPPDIADVVLWRVRPAIQALEQFKHTHTLPERVTGGRLRVPDGAGGWREESLDTATANYLRLIRNSHHSFTEMASDPAKLALLASFEAGIPDALSDLALLHVLRFLVHPRMPGQPGPPS
jgi:hypothetical protein